MAEKENIEEQVLQIKRVSKKAKGGNKISFTSLVVVGDKKGMVGIGKGKALDVNTAIQKGFAIAKKNMVKINLKEGTISHNVLIKYKAVTILLKPAPKGAGIIAGGAVRPVAELAGIKDLSAKIIGSSNREICAYATLQALKSLVPKSLMRGNR